MGGCPNYGPFLVPLNTRCRKDPKRDHDFDNHMVVIEIPEMLGGSEKWNPYTLDFHFSGPKT